MKQNPIECASTAPKKRFSQASCHVDSLKKAAGKHVKKQALKKKTLFIKPHLQSLQNQIKSNGIKWLEMESDMNWVTFKDIKKTSWKPTLKISDNDLIA